MTTPDTEMEKLVKLNRTCDCTLGWCTECLKWKGVIELALTSRDTYWKERVRKEVEGMKVWFMEEDYCNTFPLISKEDLLDNLK